MNVKTLSYFCQNCEKKFDLPEHQTPRCPNCYWTTSIRRADQPNSGRNETRTAAKSKTDLNLKPILKWAAIFLIIVGIAFSASHVFRFFLEFTRAHNQNSGKSKNAHIQPEDSRKLTVEKDAGFLSLEEKTALEKWLSFDIPRTPSSDELQMLSRRADFTMPTNTPPQMIFWTIDKFKDFLSTQQKRRKIYFSGSYESSLGKLFKNHYLTAEMALKEGDLYKSRLELLNSLVFQIYHHDPRMHKSVALVMLKEFIDDTLLKIQILNSYMMTSKLSSAVSDLEKDYATVFSSIEQKNWNAALELVKKLEESGKAIDAQTKNIQVEYPPVIRQIDPDIQRGLNLQDQTLTPLTTGLNSVLADLKIKRRVLEQNSDEALRQMKEKYTLAASAVQGKKWMDAKTALESITYPMEISEDARQKLLIVAKILDRAETAPAKTS